MPLVTLEIPQNKMPLVKEFIHEIGLNEKNVKSSNSGYFQSSTANSRHYLPTRYTVSSKGWEFYSNELEYE